MKELKIALKNTLFWQFLCWTVFILCDETMRSADLSLVIGIILLLVILILYFVHINKIIQRNELNPVKYNLFLFFLWIIMSIIITIIFAILIENNILQPCHSDGWDCFLNGIEYLIQGFLSIILPFIILVIKAMIIIYQYFKKRKN